MKQNLAIFDMDGTLFDTKAVNYASYKAAAEMIGRSFDVDYGFYCAYCNGRKYKDFLPRILPGVTAEEMEAIHRHKKGLYAGNLDKARINTALFDLIRGIRETHFVALVTTASGQNTMDILGRFQVTEMFDLILTQESIAHPKPDPEGFLRAMAHFGVDAAHTVIFEDSDVGLEAAEKSGAAYVRVYGYN